MIETTTPERGRGLALVGYRGTGKSTIGRMVARRSDREFVDADKEIERRAGKSIRAIFQEDGEPAFRDMEERVILDLCERTDIVLATGGGAILRKVNRDAIRRFGLVVWLTAPPEILAARLARDAREEQGRPALTSAGTLGEIATVMAARFDYYAEASDVTIDTDGRPPTRVSELVHKTWTDWLASGGRLFEVGPS